ncbi:MAG: calcium/sodium antiporter [archaeon]|nr:calcium/sodium antiporter [archaeon]
MDWVLLGIPLGIVMLYFGSDWLVKGAKNLALRLGIAPFVVGLTVIAFGSSAPEIITAVVSSDTPDIVLGNALGSNIANVGIAIGLAALVCPMAAVYKSMKVEITAMIIASLVVFAMALTGTIGLVFGIILLAFLVGFLVLVYMMKKNDTAGQAAYTDDVEDDGIKGSYPILLALIAIGLVLLYYGATFFVDGATCLAKMIGISDLLVGLIIVAIGTSLPEICICLIAAKKGENELAVANIVGSNIFNATAVLGTGAVLANISVSDTVLMFHLPVMILLSVMLYAMVRFKNNISRVSAVMLMGVYVAYLAFMVAVPSLAM